MQRMAVKVLTPNKFYTEEFMGANFVQGEAIVEDEAVAYEMAKRFGYTVVPLEPKAEPKKAPAKKAPAKKKAPVKKEG